MKKNIRRLLALALGACLLLGVTAQAAKTESAVTRGRFIQALYDADRARYGNQGTTDPVAWARSLGVVQGYADGSIRPETAVTRTQLAVMLYRYAGMTRGLKDLIPLVLPVDALAGYEDAGAVPAWADAAVKWAVTRGLWFSGSAARLDPGSPVTQAECETALLTIYSGGARLEADWTGANTAADVKLAVETSAAGRVTYRISSTGSDWMTFGAGASLYRKVNGGWYDLDGLDRSTGEYAMGPGESRSYTMEKLNGQAMALPAGEYRVAQTLARGATPHSPAAYQTPCRLYADFTIS